MDKLLEDLIKEQIEGIFNLKITDEEKIKMITKIVTESLRFATIPYSK